MQQSNRLGPELFSSASDLPAAAFHSNPAHVYIFPDETDRQSRLRWLLGGNLRAQPNLDRSFCLADGHRVNAMGFWTHSASPSPGLFHQLRAGLLLAPIRLGVSGMRRMYEVTRSIERHLESALPGPHWYLNNMVVHGRLRGRGVGTDLLSEEIRKVSALSPESSFALSTQREENVVFYGRLGFEVKHSEIIGTGSHLFRNWIMVRPSDIASSAGRRTEPGTGRNP